MLTILIEPLTVCEKGLTCGQMKWSKNKILKILKIQHNVYIIRVAFVTIKLQP